MLMSLRANTFIGNIASSMSWNIWEIRHLNNPDACCAFHSDHNKYLDWRRK